MPVKNIYLVVKITTGQIAGRFQTPMEALEETARMDDDQYRAMITPSDFTELTAQAMVSLYNSISVRSVDKFDSPEAGASRLRKFLIPTTINTKENAMNVPRASSTKGSTTKKKAAPKKKAAAPKKKAAAPKKKAAAPKKKAAAPKKKAAAPKKKAATLASAQRGAATARVASEAGYKNASQMFRALIKEGKLDDDEIFLSVQKAFGLLDNKRRYVAWYRKDIARKG